MYLVHSIIKKLSKSCKIAKISTKGNLPNRIEEHEGKKKDQTLPPNAHLWLVAFECKNFGWTLTWSMPSANTNEIKVIWRICSSIVREYYRFNLVNYTLYFISNSSYSCVYIATLCNYFKNYIIGKDNMSKYSIDSLKEIVHIYYMLNHVTFSYYYYFYILLVLWFLLLSVVPRL